MERITYGKTDIAYTICRRAGRRTIAITVNPDISVTVSVPKGTRRTRIKEEVRRKAAWIVKHQDWLRRRFRFSLVTIRLASAAPGAGANVLNRL